jgi:hypothetical protein
MPIGEGEQLVAREEVEDIRSDAQTRSGPGVARAVLAM